MLYVNIYSVIMHFYHSSRAVSLQKRWSCTETKALRHSGYWPCHVCIMRKAELEVLHEIGFMLELVNFCIIELSLQSDNWFKALIRSFPLFQIHFFVLFTISSLFHGSWIHWCKVLSSCILSACPRLQSLLTLKIINVKFSFHCLGYSVVGLWVNYTDALIDWLSSNDSKLPAFLWQCPHKRASEDSKWNRFYTCIRKSGLLCSS